MLPVIIPFILETFLYLFLFSRYIGILLSDWLFIDEGNPKMKDGMMNVSRCSLFSNVIVFLKETQQSAYEYQPVIAFQNIFKTWTLYVDPNDKDGDDTK